MGIKILSSILTPFGVSMTNLHASVKGNFSIFKNNDGKYRVNTTVIYTADGVQNPNPVFIDGITITIEPEDLNSNIYNLIYDYLKTDLTTEDE